MSTLTKIIGPSEATDASLTITETPHVVSDNTINTSLYDGNWAVLTLAGTENNFKINVTPSPILPDYKIESLTPSLCSADADGNVARILDGTSKVLVSTPMSQRVITRVLVCSSGWATWTWTNYLPGSLGAHVYDAVAAMVLNKIPSPTTQNVYASASGGVAAPNYVRNPNLMMAAYDLSPMSIVVSTTGTSQHPVVLISPSYVIGGHIGVPPVNGQVVFKDSTGAYITRTITAISPGIGGTQNYIAELDAPVTSITPMATLPASWKQYLPGLKNGRGWLPVLNKGWAAGDKIRILLAREADGYPRSKYLVMKYADLVTDHFYGWSTAMTGGDSNGPCMLPINGKLVLVHMLHNVDGGEFYPDYITEINAAIVALGGNEQISTVDLSMFNVYDYTPLV